MKKRYYLLIFVLLLLLFRGQLFRFCVDYEPTAIRQILPADVPRIHRVVDGWLSDHPEPSVREMIRFSQKITADHLTFVLRQTTSAPDAVAVSGAANCVGYSRYFAAVLALTTELSGQTASIDQEILVGELSLLGFSLHQLTDDPFWRDHDYNKVVHKQTGEVYFLDPTLYDYTGIRWVD